MLKANIRFTSSWSFVEEDDAGYAREYLLKGDPRKVSIVTVEARGPSLWVGNRRFLLDGYGHQELPRVIAANLSKIMEILEA